MKKLSLTVLTAFACSTSPLFPALPTLADSAIQPFAYTKIGPIQQTVTKLGQALQAIKPGPQTMMVTAGMGMALGDPTFASFDPKANTGIFFFNDFNDDDEPTFVVLLKVTKESPVPAALVKNMSLAQSEHAGWTVLTNHPEALKKIGDLSPLAKFTDAKVTKEIESGFQTTPFLANAFIKESIQQLKDKANKIEDQAQAKAAAGLIEVGIAELSDIETVGFSMGIGDTALTLQYGIGLRPGSELSKAFKAPGAEVPSAAYLGREGLISGTFAYGTKDYFSYFRNILAKLEPSIGGDMAEFFKYAKEYMAESEKMFPETLSGGMNMSFGMNGMTPKPDFSMVLPMDMTFEKLMEFQQKEQEMGIKFMKVLAATPGLEEMFAPSVAFMEKNLADKKIGMKKVEIAGVPCIYFIQPIPKAEIELVPAGEEKELESAEFGYYATVKDKLMLMSTSKEGFEALLKKQIDGQKAENPLSTKLAKGEFMKADFNVKPYMLMFMGIVSSIGGKGEENPIMKEFEALEVGSWPILVTAKGNKVDSNIEASYASIKAITDFGEKMAKAAMGTGNATAGLDVEETNVDYSKIKIPMDLPIALSNGGTTTLAKLTEGKKAVLLDFWASWCGPCMALMPELKKKAAALAPQGIVVAGMNTEAEPATAERTRKKLEVDFPWLVEPEDGPFSGPLEIDSIPRMILISHEGKVLYNGHPQDPGLHNALALLGVKL